MNDNLIIILIYLLGWLILSISHFIYKVYIDDLDDFINKKIQAWRSFWIGFWSWFGILFIIVFLIVGGCALLNDWIETKLSE